jgi:hypothetical protein
MQEVYYVGSFSRPSGCKVKAAVDDVGTLAEL